MASIINAATSGGLVTSADTSGVLQLQTASTTAVTVDASQNVGIGTTSPKEKIDSRGAAVFSGDNTTGTNAFGTAEGILLSTGSGVARVTAISNGANNVNLALRSLSNGGATDAITLTPSGAVALSGAVTNAGGVGITFPTSQFASSNANTLDDYEEGTFTPTVIGTSTAGTATYSSQVGRYTKIGNRVLFNIRVSYSSGTGAGLLRISGLPFAATSASGANAAVSVYLIDIALPASTYCVPTIDPNNSYIGMFVNAVGGGADNAVSYDAAGDIFLTGHYEV
jgi:hypothetical protein